MTTEVPCYPTWDVLDGRVHSRRAGGTANNSNKAPDLMSIVIPDPDTGEDRTWLVNRTQLARLLQREETTRRRAKEKRDHDRVFRSLYQTMDFFSIFSILAVLVWVMAFAMTIKLM
jgi:hypothetical protein